MRQAYAITGNEKASILLIALGKEYSSKVLKHLGEEEIEKITVNITNTRTIDHETKELIINEFYEMCLAQNYISEGGIDYARQLLVDALGDEKAFDLITRATSSFQVKPFNFLRRADINQILNFLQNENSQTIALIFSYLMPQQAALVLRSLPMEDQTEIIERLANMGSTSPENIKEIERVLERKFSALGSEDYMAVGGIQSTVDILNMVDIGTEKHILSKLEESNKELAEEIRKRMFIFEDIIKLGDRAIQRALRDTDNKNLSIALKGSSKEVMEAVFANMSRRQQEMIKEDIEYMPPVRLRDVEEAQQKIINTIRELEEQGEIIIVRNEGDDVFV